MTKEQEKEFDKRLIKLDKDTLISLYLQKCYDTDIEISNLKKQLALLEEQDGMYHNQLAIEELEKVKEILSVNYLIHEWIPCSALEKKLNEQIEQLKGENNENYRS